MYSSTVLFVALFSRLSQQLSDSGHVNLLKQRHVMIQARQFGNGDLSFCYGETAICSEGNTLFSKCSAFEDLEDPTQWYQCLCGNGYVTADHDCYYCDLVYGIDDSDLSGLYSSQCSQYNGGTIAPLPSSVLAAVSAFNASYTGVILGGTNQPTGGSAASTSKSGGDGSAVASESATPKTATSTQGTTQSSSTSGAFTSLSATLVKTLNGGSEGTVTAAPTSNQGGVETSSPSTTLKSGSGTGGAAGLNTGFAAVFSVAAMGFSVIYLL